jgi:hypothetical protein
MVYNQNCFTPFLYPELCPMKNYIIFAAFILLAAPALAQTVTPTNALSTPHRPYIVTPGANTSDFSGAHYAQYNQLSNEERDELQQRRFEQAYDTYPHDDNDPTKPLTPAKVSK